MFNLQGFEYSRTGNPTRNGFEKAVASLECAKYGKYKIIFVK